MPARCRTTTAVATVIRDRGIRSPDLASAVPLLEQLRDALAKSDPSGAYAGITYDLTYGNELEQRLVVQSAEPLGPQGDATPSIRAAAPAAAAMPTATADLARPSGRAKGFGHSDALCRRCTT